MSHHESLKVALLSDTHGQLDGRIAEVIEGSDWIIHAGDIGNAMILHQLARQCDQLVAVRGNNDSFSQWPHQDHATLAELPHERDIHLPGGIIVVTHGHRINPAKSRHSRLRRRYSRARAVVYGHSHRLLVDTGQDPWILNPGAAGRARTHGGPSCLILRIRAQEWHVEHYRFCVHQRR